jgi:ribosomal protein S18 acetylase RimI-like enzyme
MHPTVDPSSIRVRGTVEANHRRGRVQRIEKAPSVGRAAAPEDVPAVAACLTSAFFEDPLWGLWAFPDEASRSQRLHQLMRFWSMAGVRHPWVRMTHDAEAVAVWVPPGEPELTSEEEAALESLSSDLLGTRAHELHALFERFDEHHPREEPHYYLSLWATHRDHAGRGLGTALIRDNLARIDAERMPAYLESTNPANIARYEALGFRRRDEFGSPHGPVITTMWRAAR